MLTFEFLEKVSRLFNDESYKLIDEKFTDKKLTNKKLIEIK